MARIILGVIAGFVVWSIVWVGSEQTLGALWQHLAHIAVRPREHLRMAKLLDTGPMIAAWST